MPLHLLLDENISPVVVDGIRRHSPAIRVESVHRWRGGALVNQKDETLLRTAASERWTLVTYDQRTIPSLVKALSGDGEDHSGVIYVDEHTISNRDFGLLIRSLISFWNRFQDLDWQNGELYLDRPPE